MEKEIKNITLKLEDNKTVIYISGEKYTDNDLCCGVLVNILRDDPRFSVGSWDDLNSNKESIDFIIDSRQYKSTSDGARKNRIFLFDPITPTTEEEIETHKDELWDE